MRERGPGHGGAGVVPGLELELGAEELKICGGGVGL